MNREDSISVFLADDHAMVREGLAAVVAKDSRIEVAGQCGDGLKALDEILQAKPDVAVLDITMPGLNGLDVCRELSRKCPEMGIIILTMHDDEQFIARALRNGAMGYLLKEAASAELAEAVHTVARHEMYLGTSIARGAMERILSAKEDSYERLTTRERQVLQLIAEGKTNRLIAEMLGLAVKTVDTHRSRLMRKLNIHDQTSLVKYALRRGIVSLNDTQPRDQA
jgi:DNA-binding NarL/FixJ family response regulator